jgi:hypothetical protein
MLLVMNSHPSPTISSFIIRFIQEPTEDQANLRYRGTIRHIQSNQQAGFTSWSEVEAFIERIIPFHEPDEDMGMQATNITPDQSKKIYPTRGDNHASSK